MSRVTGLTPTEQQFLDDVLAKAERVRGKKLNRMEKNMVTGQAKEQIAKARYTSRIETEKSAALQETEFSWSKPTPFRR